jgi:leucyl/phenylalanyl-tRNA---protein transferase
VRVQDPRRRGSAAERAPRRGGDLAPGTILAAYRAGIFPWPDADGRLLWWSPNPRTILPLDAFHESRSLRRRRRSGVFAASLDRACDTVIAACGEARSEGTWITAEMAAAYGRLHGLGWVHSVEVWAGTELVGGLYGIAIGGFFAAESMFHRATDASKIALAELVTHLRARGFELLDVQFLTPHLESLGCVEIPRAEYLRRLQRAIASPVLF